MAGIRVRRKWTENPPRVSADPRQIRTALNYVLVNADEALTEEGTIDVSTMVVSSSEMDVGAQAWTERDLAESYVGMSPDVVDKLFDPFFTTKGSGRGLGMSVVLSILRRHHGVVSVSSAAGRGTRVRLFFPGSGDGRSAEVFY